jgi:hypothetical protein
VPVIFDPHTGDVYNLPKYTLVVVAALALAGLWVVAAVHRRPLPLWRNGLQWLVGGIVVWTAVSAFAGVDTHVGLLGNYGSYDGLFLAAALGVVAMVTAEAFDVDDVRKVLAALAFAGGSVVLVLRAYPAPRRGVPRLETLGLHPLHNSLRSRGTSFRRSATRTTSAATWPSSSPSWSCSG